MKWGQIYLVLVLVKIIWYDMVEKNVSDSGLLPIDIQTQGKLLQEQQNVSYENKNTCRM